ncbi:MAG: FAD-dependent oxidoreductase, partial [Myxococcota bacterium]
DVDLAIVGGGIAGTCAAITAAREGLRVALVQDRPVLGGNASSEVRLWMVGATSHLGNNNRWSREGGVLNEILLENTYRNAEGNPVLFDTILLDKVVAEEGIRLLLNTAVVEVETDDDQRITAAKAFNSQNSTRYTIRAPYYCDASGDGVVGFLSGAAFRIGAESSGEFGELLASDQPTRELLGHSIYFYTRDVGRKVDYVPPGYALDDITKIPRFKRFNTKEQGTDLWWIEYGGSMDTVHETEHIKWELWKIIYGVWNYIKNSGRFDDAETLTLDWVGLIPGKRESRRFEGDYMLVQQDLVDQRTHQDAVSCGGWAIDHHPTDNIYSDEEPCTQWHCKGVYQIPYRAMYSRNVPNLFLAGRLISASHIAFGSTRVMAT